MCEAVERRVSKGPPELAASVETAAPIAANAVRIRMVHSTASTATLDSGGQTRMRPRKALPATRLNLLENHVIINVDPSPLFMSIPVDLGGSDGLAGFRSVLAQQQQPFLPEPNSSERAGLIIIRELKVKVLSYLR